MNDKIELTMNDICAKLSERVSNYNARLMLQSALIGTGLNRDNSEVLNKEEVRAICIALINKGGPAFQVGRELYQRIQ